MFPNTHCSIIWGHGPLARYVKLRVVHAPGMPGTFSPSPQVSDPDMHHGTCVTHVPWCMPWSLTSGFLWRRWCGKTFLTFPAHAQPAIFCIWWEAHGVPKLSLQPSLSFSLRKCESDRRNKYWKYYTIRSLLNSICHNGPFPYCERGLIVSFKGVRYEISNRFVQIPTLFQSDMSTLVHQFARSHEKTSNRLSHIETAPWSFAIRRISEQLFATQTTDMGCLIS